MNPYSFATISAPSDPYYSYVKILVDNQGADGSTPATAIVGGTITYVGSAALSTASYPTGQTSSLLLPSSGNHAEWLASSTDTTLTGDFTIECWFASATTQAFGRLVDIGANALSWSIDGTTTNSTVWLYSSSVGYILYGISIGNIGTGWHHIAISRTGSSVTLWLDGVQKGAAATYAGTVGGSTNGYTIGAYFKGNANTFKGNIGPSRLTKGIGRYTTTFTPPTLPL